MFKNKTILLPSEIILIGIIIILAFFNVKSCNDSAYDKKNTDQMIRTIAALNDTIKIIKNENGILASKKAPEMDPDQLVKNSILFKSLSEENQKWIKEIAGNRKLILASKVQMALKDSTIARLKRIKPGIPGKGNDSTLYCYNDNDIMEFSDSSKKFKWKAEVILGDTVDLKLVYNYDLDIKTTFEREKDKSITVKYMINDSSVNVTDIKSFVIPAEIQGKSKVGKWLYKNKKTFRAIGTGIIFGLGTVFGVLIAK